MAESNVRPDAHVLARECHVFCRYLVQQNAPAYVLSKYQSAHNSTNLFAVSPKRPFDVMLLRVAGRHPLLTRLADTYARLFLPRCQLHTKLVLLLAILESCAPTAARFHRRDAGYTPTVYARLFLALLGILIAIPAALLLFLPLHCISAANARLHARRAAPPVTVLERV